MGLETILAMAIQGAGSAAGAAVGAIPGLGTAGAIGTSTGTGLAGSITSATTGLSQSLAAAGGASAVPGTGIMGTGITGGNAAAALGKAATLAAPLAQSKPKKLNQPVKQIETNVGNKVPSLKKKRTIQSTISQKRNSLGSNSNLGG